MTIRPVLIAFSGLPGAGKTTIARRVCARLGAVLLRIDSIETALARSTRRIRPAEDAGYAVAYAVAADNLRAGLSVVADCVNDIALTRAAWADMATDAAAFLLNVEVICSDDDEHRRRVETRTPDTEGLLLPDWQAVASREFEPWTEPLLVLDTAILSVADAVARVVARTTAASPPD
ncbi:AAA family ATPase [Rubrimonas sp.]|uniref:AAA family ATPase n=1 Tax=Rubrimonas sp. TaxID=2036015 RepID=UPI002FDDE063